jgi:hypothetical protein
MKTNKCRKIYQHTKCHEPILNDPNDSSDVPTVTMFTLLIYEFKKNKGQLNSRDMTGIQKLPVLHSAYLTYERTVHLMINLLLHR